jgi:hypothetical protein
MKKFLAIGHHGPIDPAQGHAIAEQAVTWIPERLADGTFDCLYSMAGGGRLLIANAESEDALRSLLDAAPDARREWQVTELYDGLTVIQDYLRSVAD